MSGRHRRFGLTLALVAAHAALVVCGSALHALPWLRHGPALGADCHGPAWPVAWEHQDDCSVCGLARLAATPAAPTVVIVAERVERAPASRAPRDVPAPEPRAHFGRAPPRGTAA